MQKVQAWVKVEDYEQLAAKCRNLESAITDIRMALEVAELAPSDSNPPLPKQIALAKYYRVEVSPDDTKHTLDKKIGKAQRKEVL